MNASSPFADDCSSTCSTSTCFVVGQIAQPGDTVPIYLPGDAATVSVQVKNIGDGSLGFQMTANGVDWVPAQLYRQPDDEPVTATATNGLWRGSVSGMSQFRVIAGDPYAGSMAEVTIRVSPADLFVDTDMEHVNDPVLASDIVAVAITTPNTGWKPLVAGVADRKIRVHRLVLSASETVRITFGAGNGALETLLSGAETLDLKLLDFDAVYPWYETPAGEGFGIEILMADGGGAAPDVEAVEVGGTLWYSLSPLPVVVP